MRLYEVWTPKGAIAGYGDKSLADKAFRRASSPALLTLGASVLAVREGTTAKQRAAIEEALKAARVGNEVIDVPKPDPAAAKVHRLPLVARRPVEVEADETDDDTADAGDELDDDDADTDDDTADEELPTADAPRDPPADDPAVERPAVVAAPAPTKPEVSMAPKSTEQTARPTCAAKGCTNPVPPGISAGRRTVAWRGPYCHRCRDRGRKAIEDGRATAETVSTYLDGSNYRDTSAATKASVASRAAAKVVKVPRVAPTPAPVTAPEQAVELSADTIQVTIALPSDVARAYRCALAVGGVEALERLIAALPAAVRS